MKADGPANPESWVNATLGELCAKPEYGWTTGAESGARGPRFLRTTDITKGAVDWSTVPGCRDLPPAVDRYLLHSGDIVISRAGSIGMSALIQDAPAAVFASYLIRFRPHSGVEPRYLAWFLQGPVYWRQLGALSAGIAVQNVNATKLAGIRVPVPPRPEQTRISDELDRMATRFEVATSWLRQCKDKLTRYRASVLKAACEGRLVPTEAELARAEGRDYEPGKRLLSRVLSERRSRWGRDEAPERMKRFRNAYREPMPTEAESHPEIRQGWAWTNLDSLLVEPLRNGHSARAVERGVAGGVRTLTLTAVTRGEFTEENTKLTVADPVHVTDLWLRPNDLLIQRSNTPDLVGTSRVYRGPERFAIFPDLLIRVRVTNAIVSRYIEFVLQSAKIRKYFKSAAQGIAGSMPKIDQDAVRKTPIPLPPIAEQHRIVAEVERRLSIADELAATIDAALARAARLRQSILKRAFEGKLVPQDPNDEPAGVLLERIRKERAVAANTGDRKPKPHVRRGAQAKKASS